MSNYLKKIHEDYAKKNGTPALLDFELEAYNEAGIWLAKKQGCKIVVIDLDEHLLQVRPFELSKYIARRKADFISGMMEACYIVFNGNAVVVNAQEQTRREIESFINELKP